MSEKIVGLFGTCGKSTWRKEVISELESNGISYFNPQVDNWAPECALEEAKHMTKDDIIVFAVTGETAGVASLAEIGIATANVLTSREPRYLVVYIESEANPLIGEARAKDSNVARRLVIEHLSKG